MQATLQLLEARTARANRIVAAAQFDLSNAKNEICTEILLMEQMIWQLLDYLREEPSNS